MPVYEYECERCGQWDEQQSIHADKLTTCPYCGNPILRLPGRPMMNRASEREDRTPVTKVCTLCGEEKPTSEFNKHSQKKDGLNSWCKACSKEKAEEHKRHHGPPEYVPVVEKACSKCGRVLPAEKFTNDSWTSSRLSSQCRDCAHETYTVYYPKVREKILASRRTWEGRLISMRTRARRRAQMYATRKNRGCRTERFSNQDVVDRDKWICGICGQPIVGKFHIDHIVPLAQGGSDTLDNVQMAHPTCNNRKPKGKRTCSTTISVSLAAIGSRPDTALATL